MAGRIRIGLQPGATADRSAVNQWLGIPAGPAHHQHTDHRQRVIEGG